MDGIGDTGAGRFLAPAVPAADQPAAPEPAPISPLLPGDQRFQTCRWRQAAEDGVPQHCTHRDVMHMAGTTTFDPEAWCVDCGLYKVRRNPRKRPFTPPDQRDRY